MSDFFGGILDDMRGIVTDANSFFNYTSNPNADPLGKAAAIAASVGQSPQGNFNKLWEAERLSKMNNVDMAHNASQPGYRPAADLDKSNENHSVNFEQVEQSWLTRMRRFSQIDEQMASGKVNEGADR